MTGIFDPGIFDPGIFDTAESGDGGGEITPEPPQPQPVGGGDSQSSRKIADPDRWWKSPPKKVRKANETETGAPIEAPLSVSDPAEAEAVQARLRAEAAQAAIAMTKAEQERERLRADNEAAEILLLLAA